MALRKVVIPSTAEQIEKSIVTAILEGELSPGASLPSERDLAAQLGVTRPTLRETLKQLAKEGWIIIQHGRPTTVADFWQEGGLGVLKTLAKHGDMISPELIGHLLDFRASLQPVVAVAAARRGHGEMLELLSQAPEAAASAKDFAEFDWRLQALMADLSGNPIHRLIINDFAGAFSVLARFYFKKPEQRRRSRSYYRALAKALENGRSVEKVVRGAMEESAQVWQKLARAAKGGGHA